MGLLDLEEIGLIHFNHSFYYLGRLSDYLRLKEHYNCLEFLSLSWPCYQLFHAFWTLTLLLYP